MGIGLNTNIAEFPADLDGKITSLQAVLGQPIDNKSILEQIITQLKQLLKSN
jgi:biotin-(acetyl-CoA carboxylase) ligase